MSLRSRGTIPKRIEIVVKKSDELKTLCTLLQGNEIVQSLMIMDLTRVEGAKAIAEMLIKNNTLLSLELYGNNIGGEGANAIAGALKKNKSLQSLNLSANHICNEGAKAVAEMLKQNSTLYDLELSWNNIGDEGAKAIVEMLKQNKTLQSLNLWNNIFCREQAKAMATILKQNTTLVELVMHCDKFLRRQISNILQRNRLLKWKGVDENIQRMFIGLHAAFGNDVYIFLLLIDSLPHYVLLDRSRKVALMQSFIKKQI